MAKVALLIGVSEYNEPSLTPLPGASKDVEAVQRVLQHPEMGDFDEVSTLSNPDPIAMQEAIQTLFSDREKEDLVLLFFSGHGIKDENGRLYFATRITRKNKQGELVKATAVPASFVQDIMSNSRSKRQVVILDCCFSGAFAEGLLVKSDASIDVKNQLGGEGRAVLTSSASTQYSFEQKGLELSTYTHYFIEGIETGAADLDNDGLIFVDELHEYAKKRVQEAAPAMKPEIYAVKEGYKILIANTHIIEDYKGAIEDYNQYLRFNPNDVDAYNNRCFAYNKLDNYQQAISDCNKAIQINDKYDLAYRNRGDAYYYQGKYEQAIADYNKAIELNPKKALFYNDRGLAYNEQGKYEQAIADYNKAIELKYDPLNISYINRGNAYDNLGDYKKAIEDYNRAISIDSNDGDAFYNRGNTRSKLGDKQEAIQDFQKAAQLYQKQGNTKDYQDALDRIKKLQQ